ncbi:lysophospholipid acyltransferase family protein [Oceanimonas doudoroffii]|uniref:1-acyl-sn-glycerol-3-phosphate acyltransferase n=1 Tax=Oceanimonas doudoroffii TaxID=84158 RepID=A0A233RCA4_9GAMM|nr:lysophospholipid acyltransferase family protein [Oceanimonas doudoroffii]OXY81026.1 1-acyl-sn-glycerol-3-phosphate acyltransferase [Oceanimonas doudoroffii]
MPASLNHLWRWCATAFSFLVFGLGGILLPLLALPVLYCLPGTTRQREHQGQRLIHHVFRGYIGMMKGLGVLSYEVENREKLRDARLILANHPSLIDVVFLIALVPNANCVVKGKLLRNPFTRGALKLAGYIINEDNEKVIAAAGDAFAKGDALIIFPEGTRTTPGMPLSFKRGAANVAIRNGADITPVLISCRPGTLSKQDPWYRVPAARVHVRIRVNDTIPVAAWLRESVPSLAARQLTADLADYFTEELTRYEQPAVGSKADDY